MRTLRIPALALLSLLLLAGAACSSSGSGGEIAEVFRVASSKTLEAETMQFSVSTDLPGAGRMTGTGEFDSRSGLMAMSLEFPALAPGEPPFETEQILSGTTMYMRSGLFGLPPEVWMKIDLAEMGQELGIDFAALLEQSRESDPRAQLSFLEGVGSRAKEVGKGVVRGVDTTHYEVLIDVREALAGLPEGAADLRGLVDQLGVDELPAEVWIDDHGQVRRMAYEMPLPDGAGGSQAVTMSMDFFGFGEPVEVEEPAAEQTIDFAELLAQLG